MADPKLQSLLQSLLTKNYLSTWALEIKEALKSEVEAIRQQV